MRLIGGARVFTAGAAGTLASGSVAVDGQRIAWVGEGEPPDAIASQVTETVDLRGALLTPGLIDAHTHPVYVEPRLAEVAERSAGATYAEVARAGGGIRATVSSTRAAAHDQLAAAVRSRTPPRARSGRPPP